VGGGCGGEGEPGGLRCRGGVGAVGAGGGWRVGGRRLGGAGLCPEVGELGCGHVKVRNVGSRGGVGAVVCVVEVAGMMGATG
jgi:hypothetical protein